MDLLICGTCGVQYDSHAVKSCKICDDPRQYVAEDGQWFTTLRELQDSKKYRNVFTKDKYNSGVVAVRTEPPVAIGQRAFLLRSPAGNLLWDCITYIDDDTVRRVNELGGIAAIVISHPHYFSTALHWAEAFGCKVYVSAEDGEWLTRRGDAHVLWEGRDMEFLGGQFLAVKVAGHFPGSSVLLWRSERKLFVADSVMVVPSGVYHVDRPPGTASFAFMWSYPNMIPLSPEDVYDIWKAVSKLDFEDAHSAFPGRDARGDAKRRLLDSAQIFVKSVGYIDHPIHGESI
ncbi:metallo-beta-lactamase superfamily protein [Colletotrichum higginsianum]|uniref:Metallo-beta-lactamase superfamily protein n=1 Tax=Colletotrichum higginsianum (strain IMI 349063) TaxID=759273 RepID=H1VGQ6_COLHI|nr:Metallo-beta-lactamase superfamily protein [Colletotrichum higginsianum IMI 349063]OBR14635.1 Metallo-beta-lactamase superfamily protein [Colletotrichum higginsianum IMI 349063]GJD05369.1 metallo-betalactamase superfamily protein [Colletotrichum higginsianum]CCF39409.1 metallo-beta-lactamase superfamily protein [Colletotrichum higginsianum]